MEEEGLSEHQNLGVKSVQGASPEEPAIEYFDYSSYKKAISKFLANKKRLVSYVGTKWIIDCNEEYVFQAPVQHGADE